MRCIYRLVSLTFECSTQCWNRIAVNVQTVNKESERFDSDTPSMNDQKTKLAVRVVGDHFGDVVQNIAKVLTEGDHCTLPYIFRSVNANLAAQNNGGAAMLASGNSKISSIDGATVRQALMILHQHNCLHIDVPRTSEYETSQKVVQTGFHYSLNVNNIVHRLQFARLLAMVRSKFGELAVLVMEAVILHGKVRLDQIQDVVAQVQEQDSKKEGPAFTAYEIKSAFETLVSNRFLVTVPFANATKVAVNPDVVEDTKKASNKRTFDLMAGIAPTAAVPANKRGAGINKTVTAPSNRRAAGPKLVVKEETDDGIPVELRMMMMGPEAASSSSVIGAASALNSVGTVKRVAPGAGRMAEDAEWMDDSVTAAPAKGGRGGAGRGATGGRTAGGAGRGAAGGRLVGAGRGTAASAAAAAASSALTSGADISALVKGEVELSDSASNTSSSSSTGAGAAAVPLWMVGWDQFLRETRHEACVQVVTLLHESMSGSVVRIMLALSMGTEMGANQSKSGEVNVADIFAQLDREYHAENAANNSGKAGAAGVGAMKKKPAVRLDLISLKRLLEYLRLSESGAVIKVVGSETEIGGPSYMVNIDGLVNTLQRRTVFSVASERFGFVSARIVELLQRHRYLEQQQVCDMALLPARETRERLYKLFLDKWVNYIDLSKRSDFNPSTSHYFWYLDLPLLKATIRDHVYQTIYNLNLRRAHESEQGRELLDRENVIDNEADRRKHARLMNRLNKLDLALQRVANTALLMEYC